MFHSDTAENRRQSEKNRFGWVNHHGLDLRVNRAACRQQKGDEKQGDSCLGHDSSSLFPAVADDVLS
jgi:hypothetical protein